jgi:hypothetical protein
VEDWETFPPLELYKSTIEKHRDTIEVNTSLESQEAAHSLLTLRETPETEPALVGAPTNIDTSLDSPGTESMEEYITESKQIEWILTALEEPEIKASRDYMSKVAIGLNDQKKELSRVFAYPDHEIKLIVAKGASSKNIVKGKYICKPMAFYFEHIY